MQYPIPVWAIKLLVALEEHEEVHADDKDPHTCVKGILDEVPADVRAHVSAWHDGYKAAKNERDREARDMSKPPRAQGGPFLGSRPMIFERDPDGVIVMEQR